MKIFQDRYSKMFRDATRGAGHDASGCPPSASLAGLAGGRVWPWQRRRLVEHISHCSDCAADYRVLTAARSGLLTALEGQAHADKGISGGWRWHTGMAAMAALVVVALSVSMLIQTDVPTPATDNRVLFASEFEPGQAQANHQSDHDRLFTSDFGEAEGTGGKLFRDNFGG